ncbi:MAG: Y-family DNA polymerase, partial [Chlamydiia bacterium]|nr:Y-family DNA polymerase [Chlamydiia bacterium]
MRSMLVALIDCNNFYASCEQVFNPTYQKRPLVVLSNNDGCIIARSKEARALGIPMGAPAFAYKSLFLQHRVIVLSSNFALYGDMSHRVMETLKTFDLPLEMYSIDEAFLSLPEENCVELGKEIQKRVKKWTGLSISVGIAPTKTLAKVANHAAKKGSGVVLYQEGLLENLPVGEIWGIGHRTRKKLLSHGIRYAHELIKRHDPWIKKELSITGLRTVWELRGTPCLETQEVSSS